MKKILYTFIAFLSLNILFHSCAKEEKVVAIDSTAMTLALVPTMDNLPLYYAAETGIFDSLGLDIRLLTYSSAMDCDTAFTNGEADGVVSDIIKANIWRANGDSVKVVMSTDINLYLITAHSARLKALPSIKEKIIAITRNSALDYIADKMLDSAKLGQLELNRPQINDIELRMRMTNQNQYDGALLPEPFAKAAELQGANRLIGLSALSENLSAVVFHDSTAIKRADDIKKLIIAYDMAVAKLNKLAEEGNNPPFSILPFKSPIDIPDSIDMTTTFKAASLPTHNIVKIAGEWAQGRELIKVQAEYKDLIDSILINK